MADNLGDINVGTKPSFINSRRKEEIDTLASTYVGKNSVIGMSLIKERQPPNAVCILWQFDSRFPN